MTIDSIASGVLTVFSGCSRACGHPSLELLTIEPLVHHGDSHFWLIVLNYKVVCVSNAASSSNAHPIPRCPAFSIVAKAAESMRLRDNLNELSR